MINIQHPALLQSQVQRGSNALLKCLFFNTHSCVMSVLCLLIEKLCFQRCLPSVA